MKKTLITCHANADCDAFAAMLAARHLYDKPGLLFPGTQEKGLAKLYSCIDTQKYNFVEAQDIDWTEYDRLVLVDTCQKSRVPHVARLLARDDVDIEIWDHHPNSQEDIRAAKKYESSAGAITSAICLELKKRNVALDCAEATLLGLGIYGDTGSFTYTSTTVDDFTAAAWLLSRGMDVNLINEMANHELTGLHIQALNSLLESAKTYMIGDIPVVLAEASMEHYLGDFAILAQKLMEMEKFTILFAIGIMGDRIQVVARSRVDSVNVGEICAELGGGGHTYAASASVRSKMITEVREIILRRLAERIGPRKRARDYMSAPAIGVPSTSSIQEADELMLHFGLKAVPVFQPNSRVCVGLLDAQMAARANAHGLGAEEVAEYMQRRIITLPPGASIDELTEAIVGARQRLVPIVENGEVCGVVTRTDMINVFASNLGNMASYKLNAEKHHNVQKLVMERLPEETRKILKLAGEIGKKMGMPVYAVGGFARDLLLNRPNKDIDLVAEGNGIALARVLARELGGRVRAHEKFLTSVVIYHDALGEECHIDVATARLEYYEYPAALPTVELSSIKMDLFRRDFSINALAIRLDCEPAGQLVDFFGGRRDIKDKIIRVLHTLSFVEDPTRCLRAARFEQRYKFRLGPGTEKLLRNILPMRLLEKLSPQRIFNEFRHICEEENSAECILRLDDLGILNALGPKLALTPTQKTLVGRMKKILAWYRLLFFEERVQSWICYFLVLSHKLNYADTSTNYRRLGLPEGKKSGIMRQREHMRAISSKLAQWQKKEDQCGARVSDFCEMLADASLEILLYSMAAADDPGLEKSLSRYITQWRREKADINGNDLRRLGIKPGPVYAALLKSALMAKLDGKAPTAKSQIAAALKEWKILAESENQCLPQAESMCNISLQ